MSIIIATFFTAFFGALFRWFGFFLHVWICVLTLLLGALNIWHELSHRSRNQLKYTHNKTKPTS